MFTGVSLSSALAYSGLNVNDSASQRLLFGFEKELEEKILQLRSYGTFSEYKVLGYFSYFLYFYITYFNCDLVLRIFQKKKKALILIIFISTNTVWNFVVFTKSFGI